MDDETLSFENHRRRREENASLVRCARCGKMILATATQCPKCHVSFQGEAQDYLHPSERPETSQHSWWVVLIAALLLVAMVVGYLSML